jgi:hypothetical protein
MSVLYIVPVTQKTGIMFKDRSDKLQGVYDALMAQGIKEGYALEETEHTNVDGVAYLRLVLKTRNYSVSFEVEEN